MEGLQQFETSTPTSGLLDFEQLANWLNDSVRHLRRLVHEERIPYIKLGHFIRFDPAAVTEWLNENRHGTSA
jgi:excisionase family DNA binding protein